VIGTRALIDVSDEVSAEADIVVEVELFADIEINGERTRLRGSIYFASIDLDRDPTNQLVEAAHLQQETNL